VSNPLNDDGVVGGGGEDGDDDAARPAAAAAAAVEKHVRGHRVAGGRRVPRGATSLAGQAVGHTARFACAVVLVSGPSGLRFASDAHADAFRANAKGELLAARHVERSTGNAHHYWRLPYHTHACAAIPEGPCHSATNTRPAIVCSLTHATVTCHAPLAPRTDTRVPTFHPATTLFRAAANAACLPLPNRLCGVRLGGAALPAAGHRPRRGRQRGDPERLRTVRTSISKSLVDSPCARRTALSLPPPKKNKRLSPLSCLLLVSRMGLDNSWSVGRCLVGWCLGVGCGLVAGFGLWSLRNCPDAPPKAVRRDRAAGQ